MNQLQNLLDRPIAFHRCFVNLKIGITGAVMLSQALYWSKRTSNSAGWFYKSIEEWEEETGLTRFEQETAKRKLKGILEIKRQGIPARLYFRINWDMLEKSLNNHSLLKSSNQECGNPANRIAEKQQTRFLDPRNLYKGTETTSEITTEITIPPSPHSGRMEESKLFSTPPVENQNRQTHPLKKNQPKKEEKTFSAITMEIPEWLPFEDWKDFVQHRIELRIPLTETGATRAISTLKSLLVEGHSPTDVIGQTILNNYRGLFPLKKADRNNYQVPQRKTFDEMRREQNQKVAREFIAEMDLKEKGCLQNVSDLS